MTSIASYRGRLNSIDLVRGTVMVIMALDHVRWFFTNLGFPPEDMAHTNLALFLTRWITHFSAPGFFLIAGIGIFLYGHKLNSTRRLVGYLLSRGIFLVVLELTIVGYAWEFRPGASFGGVIWALGWSFILMSVIVLIPRWAAIGLASAFLILHNFIAGVVTAPEGGWPLILWRMFYAPGQAVVPGIGDYSFLFPVLPWMAMMVLGYGFGMFFTLGRQKKQRTLFILGLVFVLAFAVLRLTNLYGNPEWGLFLSSNTPGTFAVQETTSASIISFLNVEKYPPSLQFTLMTLGPLLMWLGVSRMDGRDRLNPLAAGLIIVGRVPLFFYVLHLYLIHVLAILAGIAAGQPVTWLLFNENAGSVRTPGYGFDLWVIYAMWMVCLVLLFLACRWYAEYKRTHQYFWLKYV